MEELQKKPFVVTELLEEYNAYLHLEERSINTVKKYVHDLQVFLTFLAGRLLTKEILLEWKNHLTENYAPASINSMLAAVNSFLEWAGLRELRIKPLNYQKIIS